jgi:ketosteroid isomerase-like protein
MSQENVEAIKSAWPSGIEMVDLFRTSTDLDLSAAGVDLAVFESGFETEFIASRAAGAIRPSSRGLQGFAEAWRDWLEPWERYYIEVEEFIDAGDDVVSLVRVQAQSARDAVPVEHQPAALWSMRAGKIVRVRFYLEREEALEAAGLQEQARSRIGDAPG